MADRAVEQDDMDSAARGLCLTERGYLYLRNLRRIHDASPRFASRVIVAAVDAELNRRDGLQRNRKGDANG